MSQVDKDYFAGVGVSVKTDSYEAGQEAAAIACGDIALPVIVFLFLTDEYTPSAVLDGVKKVVGGAKIAGASMAGLFTRNEVLTRGVGVLALAGKNLSAKTAMASFSENSAKKAGAKVGLSLAQGSNETGAIFCFPDGLAPNIAKAISGLYNEMGPRYVYAGGGTGDNLRFVQTYQLTENGVYSDSIVAALIEGIRFVSKVDHDWIPQNKTLVITDAEGKIVRKIDGKPAFQVYSSILGIDKDDSSYYFMKNPIGITDAFGKQIVRDPLKVIDDDAIVFVSEIPSRAIACVLEPDGKRSFALAQSLSETYKESKNPFFSLVFYCVSRSLLLQDDYKQEIETLLHPLSNDFPVLGCLTFGEIGAYGRVPLLHNKSICIAFGCEL
ncbi:MAG: histidine kinase [Desulforudis sp.]|nr:MAG: histidine kinase [Desulforudis sp.]